MTTKSGGVDTHLSVVESHFSVFPLGLNTELTHQYKEETEYDLITSCVPNTYVISLNPHHNPLFHVSQEGNARPGENETRRELSKQHTLSAYSINALHPLTKH